jgi:agmatine deiminase
MISVAAGEEDPNAARFEEDRAVLAEASDAGGRSFEVLDGPVNAWAEIDGLGRVVIPYLNSYLVNGGVIVPVGGIPEDEAALEIIGKALPDREAVGVPAPLISHGGGGPHCITQQIPAGSFVS